MTAHETPIASTERQSGEPRRIAYSVDDVGSVLLDAATEAWVDKETSWLRFGLYHAICRDYYLRIQGGPPPVPEDGTALEQLGALQVPGMLSRADSETLSLSITQAFERLQTPLDKASEHVFWAPWSMQRISMVRGLLPEILSPAVTKEIEHYFGCHFQIVSMVLNRLFASGDEPGVSFLWHRDHVPPQQLHMIVYLTGASDEFGRTEVMDMDATRRAADTGYSYPPEAQRTGDLAEIFGDGASTVSVLQPELDPGGGLFLAAPRVLHRGIVPKTKWRDTMMCVLIPCPIPFEARAQALFPLQYRDDSNLITNAFSPFGAFSTISMAQHGVAPNWAKKSKMRGDDRFELEYVGS